MSIQHGALSLTVSVHQEKTHELQGKCVGFSLKNRKSYTFTTEVTCLKIAGFNSMLRNTEKQVFLNKRVLKNFSVDKDLSLVSLPEMVKFSGLNINNRCHPVTPVLDTVIINIAVTQNCQICSCASFCYTHTTRINCINLYRLSHFLIFTGRNIKPCQQSHMCVLKI